MKRVFAAAVLGLAFFAAGAGRAQERAPRPDMTVDAAARAEVIDAVVRNLRDYYVSPSVAAEAERDIRERQRRGEFDSVTSAAGLAKALTARLREVSKDKHLSVNYSHEPVPVRRGGEPTEEGRRGLRNYGETINYGFERVERLAGNVGYVRLNIFFPVEYGGDTAVAAMRLVADTEALIIDLRGNDGGHPDMIVLLASYLFGHEPVQLSGLFRRQTGAVQQYWTMPYVPGRRYVGKEVYVLTSRRTFSGGEAFAYDLKNLKRATLVGETTEGAANPRDVYRINEHFWMGVPNARPVSPVTQTNWEGAGVEPDVAVPAELALKTAHLAALKKLLEASAAGTDEARKERLRKAVEAAQKELDELKKGGSK
ncbi:MAG TPA: S41 family peptidase [Pyrinomonadaceae bacterium]|jgi:C-terminal processing protease CtpA/Prc